MEKTIINQLETEYLKGRKPEDFLKEIQKKQVTHVIDVRYWFVYPIYFTPLHFKNFLNLNGIKYSSYQDLGNPSSLRKKAGIDHEKAKELYLNYINWYGYPVKLLLDTIISHPDDIFCFICYCPVKEDSDKCHRIWIKNQLIKLCQDEKYLLKTGINLIKKYNGKKKFIEIIKNERQ